ncbi:MAG: hypothetical protein HY318_19180 [Armatimonadetes bacterium]|nr:hypothetical protein [Armatimonadota bacterium]
MMNRLKTCLTILPLLLLLNLPALLAAEKQPFGVPLKPDPPPAIDGRLDEWSGVPNARLVNRKEQAVYGGNKWQSTRDLSGKLWFAWRQEYLYLAVDIVDDRLTQKARGYGMWQGDHLELYLDLTPEADPGRDSFRQGKGQMQLGLSPGNFSHTGDPMVDTPPEAVVFYPEGVAPKGVLVAAQKTDAGYILEAAIPWSLLGIQQPATGMALGVEVGLSDTDGTEPVQEKMMTLLTETWAHTRSRMAPAVLSPASGVAPPVVRGIEVFKSFTVPRGSKQEIRFKGALLPKGKGAVLTFRARWDFRTVAGYNPAMRLTFNGTALDGKRLMNKEPTEEMADGRSQSSAAGDLLTVPYAPDFDSADNDPYYAFRNSKVSQFDFRVTDLLKAEDNLLVCENAIGGEMQNPLVVGEGRLEFRTPVPPKVKRPAPTGPLTVIEPSQSLKVRYFLKENPDRSMVVSVNGTSFRLESRFSTPKPAWVTGSNDYFRLKREIERRDEAIILRDTYTNLTDENLPIMQRHTLTPFAAARAADGKPATDGKGLPLSRKSVKGAKVKVTVTSAAPAIGAAVGTFSKVWLAGLSPSTRNVSTSDPGNPTTYAVTEKAGVGLMALDDVFQVHVTNFSTDTSVGLADNQFVLKPRAQHTVEWALLPTSVPDYYAFLNAARRLRDVNFTLDGSFCFLRADPRTVTDKWTDKQFTDFIRNKNAKYVCDSFTWPTYRGLFPHGTAFQTLDWSYLRNQMARLRTLVPESKHILYFHCFIDVLREAPQKYPDARLLASDGKQVDYGEPDDRIFVPTETNAFGRDITRNVDMIIGPLPDGLGCEGVYWDELEYSKSKYHYDDFSKPKVGLPWDGVSADIDPKTMQISRLKSSTTLISQPFRIALAKRLLQHGPLVGNGQPHTRTMAALHFPRFVETGSISHCASAQIFTPIALGDHLTERSPVDAYRVMLKALDYGCVYYWYDDVHVGIPTHAFLTSYMFPITPLEIHEGHLLGKERIVTNRSGMYGWGDSSKHEVHVFNDQGQEIKGFKAPTVLKNGKTYTELRIAEDWSAAILRKPPPK